MIQRTSLFAALLLTSIAVAAPPVQTSIATRLGPKLFRDGDAIEIKDVTATSDKLEQGDSVTIKGRARLQSCSSATLCLFLTQTEGDGSEETDPSQTVTIDKGIHDFELQITIKHRGVLHVTFYDSNTGKPIGGTYFGTEQQMKSIADWDLQYYLPISAH